MKKIEAIIRKSKFEDVKNALHDVDIQFFTFWDITGVGKETEEHIYRGAIYEANRIQRRMLSIIVRDQNADKTIEAIIKAAQTGVVGDGKIFVSDIGDVVRIRTGERGPEALYIKEDEPALKN